jgi:hypothetical protein
VFSNSTLSDVTCNSFYSVYSNLILSLNLTGEGIPETKDSVVVVDDGRVARNLYFKHKVYDVYMGADGTDNNFSKCNSDLYCNTLPFVLNLLQSDDNACEITTANVNFKDDVLHNTS